MRNHLESVGWGTSTCLDNAEADIASGPVIFCIIAFLNISEYCMSTSSAPKMNFAERYLPAADGEAPRGASPSAAGKYLSAKFIFGAEEVDMQYSDMFKNAMIQKMTGPDAISASALSKQVDVPQPTLSKWLRMAGVGPSYDLNN